MRRVLPRGEEAWTEYGLASATAKLESLVISSAQTDGRGFYHLTAPPGVWDIRASAPGYAPRCLRLLPLVGDARLPAVGLEPVTMARVEVFEGSVPGRAVLLRIDVDKPQDDRWGPCPQLLRARAGVAELPLGPAEIGEVEVGAYASGFQEAWQPAQEETRIFLRKSTPIDLEIKLLENREPRRTPECIALSGKGRWPVARSESDGTLSLSSLPSPEVDLELVCADGRRVRVDVPVPSDGSPLLLDLPGRQLFEGRLVTYSPELDTGEDGDLGSAARPVADGVVWSHGDAGTWERTAGDGSFELAYADIDVESERKPYLHFWAAADGYQKAEQFWSESELASRVEGMSRIFTGLEMWMVPELNRSTVSGRLTGTDGTAVVGADLRLVEPSPFLTPGAMAGVLPESSKDAIENWQTSDADGGFQLHSSPGYYDLVVHHADYAPAIFHSIEVQAKPAPNELGEFVLVPGHAVHGSVTDSNGNPLPAATVEVLFSGLADGERFDVESRVHEPALTDGQGRFLVGRLPESDVDLRVRHPGFVPKHIVVRPPVAERVEISLERTGAIYGRVVDENGAAVPEAMVSILMDHSIDQAISSLPPWAIPRGADLSTQAGTEGHFVLEELPPGRWRVAASAGGYVPAEIRAIDVEEDEIVEDLEIVLPKGELLSGRVISDQGSPVAEARVTAGGASTLSLADGTFRFLQPMPRGLISVVADHPDAGVDRRTVDLAVDTEPVRLVLEASLRVSGRVVDIADLGLGDVSVRARSRWENVSVISGPDGRFGFRSLVPGQYLVTAFKTGLELRGGEISLLLDESPVENLRLVMERARKGRVSGEIAGLTAAELSSVVVEALRDRTLRWKTRPEPDGSYQLEGLDPGEWVVTATVEGSSRTVARSVVLTRNTDQVSADLRFGSGRSVEGSIMYNGEPLGGADVLWLSGVAVVATARTDWRGRFSRAEAPEVSAIEIVPRHRGSLRILAKIDPEETRLDLSISTGSVPSHGRCSEGAAAFTVVNWTYVYLCNSFANLSVKDAAVRVIHEALHTAGLPERTQPGQNLPTSQEITQKVRQLCSGL